MIKKCLFSIALLMASVGLHANQLIVMNFTPCSYFVDLFEGGRIYVTPGYNVTFSDPSQVGAGAPATGTFMSATVRRDNYPDAIGVGSAPMYPQQAMTSDVINDYPACNFGNAYGAYWNASGDVVLLIL